MSNLNDFRQLVAMWMNSDKNPDRAALSLWNYMQPRTITTKDQLDALPDRSVITAATTETYVAIKRMDGQNWWLKAGSDSPHSSGQVTLPVTVLHEPNA